MSRLRSELPPMPAPIARLPVARGYPVPWFVAWLDEKERPVRRGTGTPDFRVLHPDAIEDALAGNLCWICGGAMSRNVAVAFVVGPMCAVNRVSAEPCSHVYCADWSARACPFLTRPKAKRREDVPEAATEAAGIALMRNPGVALVWLTRNPSYRIVQNGKLFDIGDPVQARWYAHGRRATREEVMASIESGFPLLEELAAEQGEDALRELGAMVVAARDLVPTS